MNLHKGVNRSLWALLADDIPSRDDEYRGEHTLKPVNRSIGLDPSELRIVPIRLFVGFF